MSIDTLKSGRGLALLLVAVAVAMFAGGAFASAAWSGDESKTVLNVNPSAWNSSGQAGVPAAPETARDDAKVGMAQPGVAPDVDADRLASPIYWPGCQAPLPGILSGGGVNLALAGFDLRQLGSGFSLISFAVRSEGECDDEGHATTGSLVVDTGWRHNDTELDVWVSQRVADEPVANVRYPESATVYDGGYTFNVNVNAYRILPYEKPLGAPEVATDSSAPYGSDPRAPGVLDAALAQLVPHIPAGCYYRQSEGTWDDLATLGVGDPRPAIPAGYTEGFVSILTFIAPDTGCAGASLPNPVGAGSFNANFANSAGDSISVSAYSMPDSSETYPGYMDEWSASWTRNGLTFSIWGGRVDGTGVGAEVIQAIATAMDPAFTAVCMPRALVLPASGLEAYGIRSPLLPEGYTITSFNGSTNAVDPACTNPDPKFRAETTASWTMESGEGFVEVFASKYDDSTSPREGAIFENGIKWSDGKGGFYYVQAHSRGISPIFDRDTLIAIATSMDPEFDVDTLDEVDASGGGSTGVARDMPAPESTR